MHGARSGATDSHKKSDENFLLLLLLGAAFALAMAAMAHLSWPSWAWLLVRERARPPTNCTERNELLNNAVM